MTSTIDSLPRGRPRALPTTPHELHARGPLPPAHAARVMGLPQTTVCRKMDEGEFPVRVVLGITRIEPLIAWAAGEGANRATLFAVGDALKAGKGVDDVVALARELIAAQPPPVKKPRGRHAKKAAMIATSTDGDAE